MRAAETRFQAAEPLRSVSWHSDGKQFMCSHSDGSLTTWNTRVPIKPVGHTYPHGKEGSFKISLAIFPHHFTQQFNPMIYFAQDHHHHHHHDHVQNHYTQLDLMKTL